MLLNALIRNPNMIKRILIVQHRFGLTTPKTQRMLAASKVYIENGIEVFFIYSARIDEKPEALFPSIHFLRVPEGGRFDLRSYFRFYKTIKSLYDAHSVILFDDLPYYSFLFRAPKYNVFAEVTEVPLMGKQASFAKRVLIHLTLIAARHFSGLFVISNSLRKYYGERGVKNMEIINMFVDKSRFEGLHKNSNEDYIGYCGTISMYKDGVDELIRAFSVFHKKYSGYRLYLFGRFENDSVKTELIREVCDLGISSNVVFTGPVDPTELPQKLKNASILALARPANIQAQYGFPTKLGEYLATGNPVVVTKVGEIPLFLRDKENAFLVRPGDFHAFAERLCWVVEHRDRANEVAAAGEQLVYSVFSSDVQIRNAIRFINTTVTSTRYKTNQKTYL